MKSLKELCIDEIWRCMKNNEIKGALAAAVDHATRLEDLPYVFDGDVLLNVEHEETLDTERWTRRRRDGEIHGQIMPAVMEKHYKMCWNRNLRISLCAARVCWYEDGNMHCLDDAAEIHYLCIDGKWQATFRQWWYRGKKHRIGGPANELENQYWQFGKRIRK